MSELHPSQFEERVSINRNAALTSWGIAAAAVSCLALGAMPDRAPSWRLPFTGVAWGLTLLAKPLRKIVIDSERRSNDGRDISQRAWQDWLLVSMKPTAQATLTPVEEETIIPYDWSQLKAESNHILLMGPSGSGKDTSARMISTMYGDDHQILVIDCHNLKNPWQPLTVVDSTIAAFAQLRLLLEELRQRKAEGKKGLPERPPLLVIINEWLALALQAKARKLDICDRFIRVMLSEARKYGIVFLFMSQAESAEAMGLEGFAALKDAFTAIRLGKACKRYMKTSSDRLLRDYVMADKGWTCMVNDELAHHLTHYHHPRFGKNMPPVAIPPLRSLPLSIAVAVAVDDGTDDGTYQVVQPTAIPVNSDVSPSSSPSPLDAPPLPPPQNSRDFLNRCWDAGGEGEQFFSPSGDPPLDEDMGEGEAGGDDENDPIAGLDDDYLKALIFQCLSDGITDSPGMVASIWGIAKSGKSARYTKALERVRVVRNRFNL